MNKTTYALEVTSPDQLSPRRVDIPGLRIERVAVPCAEPSKLLHTVVGYPWRWSGRRDSTRQDWKTHVVREELETWVAYLGGIPAGYFELERGPGGDSRIMCVGLLPQFIGRGLGGIC